VEKHKDLWRGLFSYHCGLEREYAHAYTQEQAKVLMFRRLAKKHDVHPSVVFGYFKDHPDSVSIQIETEFKEVGD
jgi:hypothetical protein